MSNQFTATTSLEVNFERRPSGIVVAEIRNEFAQATVSLFGGQVLTWQPKHTASPVLWVSKLASFDATRAIRGGAPICWPWFGGHPENPRLPAHGYARTSPWNLERIRQTEDGATELVLSLASGADAAGSRLSKLNLTQTVLIGKALDIALTTLNISSEPQSYSEGLHTYFHVDDVAEIVVCGLDGREYVDLTDSNRRRHQSGGVTFSGEVGRVFVASQDSCTIEDRRLGRRIRVDKWGSNSTAIWNPWADVATRMTDLGSDGWRSMVCVETANALDDSVMLDAGQQATMTARYSVEALR